MAIMTLVMCASVGASSQAEKIGTLVVTDGAVRMGAAAAMS